MATELVLLVVGFLLTTVLGGILATWLQQRSWQHQHQARLAEEAHRRADAVCHSLSELLDKRLYRMLRLFYELRALAAGAGSVDVVEARLKDYDDVLYEWNDHLTLNLALVGTYFGETGRDWLNYRIYATFQQVGRQLEDLYRVTVRGANGTATLADVERQLLELNDQIYRLGVFMMTQLRGGLIGGEAPQPLLRTDSPASVKSRAVPVAGLGQER